jgi:hypothetical protein
MNLLNLMENAEAFAAKKFLSGGNCSSRQNELLLDLCNYIQWWIQAIERTNTTEEGKPTKNSKTIVLSIYNCIQWRIQTSENKGNAGKYMGKTKKERKKERKKETKKHTNKQTNKQTTK